MQCVADCDTDHPKLFEQPVLQTLQMFIGESGCWLVVLFSYLYKRVRKQKVSLDDTTYQPVASEEQGEEDDDEEGVANLSSSQTLIDPTNLSTAKPFADADAAAAARRQPLTGVKILMLASPAICDICGTTLMNVGLLFVAASIYQMTRGALVLFVGLFSVLFLRRHLGASKWISLFVVVLGVAVVGLAGALEQNKPELPGNTNPDDKADLFRRVTTLARNEVSSLEVHTAAETVLGFFLIAAAQIFTATQFVLEESIMERYSMDPLQVVGWEGLFGFIVTLVATGILHAAVGQTEAGRGGYFDAREGFYEMFHYPAIGITSLLIMISIG